MPEDTKKMHSPSSQQTTKQDLTESSKELRHSDYGIVPEKRSKQSAIPTTPSSVETNRMEGVKANSDSE